MRETFSVEVVARALGVDVEAVDIAEALQASANQVARLRVRLAGGGTRVVIGKAARGAAAAGLRREHRFFEQIAPRCDVRAPALLGVDEAADRLVLVTEDLGAAGYAPVGRAVTEAQIYGALDVLATLHARFWDDVPSDYLEAGDDGEITQCARAWPASLIRRHNIAARAALTRFTARPALTSAEIDHIYELLAAAPLCLDSRVQGRHGLTLIHADYHFFGNVFFAAGEPRPRVIDWSELKPGLGPHDVAYCLSPVPAADRVARDLAMLRWYWEQLCARGVRDYSWERCHWDLRLSLIHNAFQALFQDDVTWLRHSLRSIELHDARAVLRTWPPE